MNPIVKFARGLFTSASTPARTPKNRATLGLQSLEVREVPARLIVLDFDGTTRAETADMYRALPGWRDPATAVARESFVGEFPALQNEFGGYARYSFLDANQDGRLDRLDANLLADEVMEGVKQRFAAFGVEVVREDDTRRALAKVNNGTGGDVVMTLEGWRDGGGGQSTEGGPGDVAANRDRGAEAGGSVHFARLAADSGLTGLDARRGFVNVAANLVAHEACHAFGFEHIHDRWGESLMTPAVGLEYLTFLDANQKGDTGTRNEFRTMHTNLGSRVADPKLENASAQSVTINGSRAEFVRGPDGSVFYRRQEFPNFNITSVRGTSNAYVWSDWRSLGGFVKSFSVVQSGTNGGIVDVIGIGGNDAVWVRTSGNFTTPGTPNWQDWRSLGGVAKSPVVTTTSPDGRASVFVIGTDDAVYVRSQVSTGSFQWSGWTSLGGKVKSLTDGRSATGEFVLAGISQTDTAIVNRQTGPNTVNQFAGWQDLGGAVKQVVVGANRDGRLQVFAIDATDAVVTTAQTAPGTATWGGWSNLGGVVSKIALGQDADGRLRVFGIGANKAVFVATQTTPNAAQFGGWASVGGQVKDIRVDSRASGRIQVFAVGLDDRVWTLNQARENADNWTAWRVAPATPVGVQDVARTTVLDGANANDAVSVERVGNDIRVTQNGRSRLVNMTARRNEIVIDLKGGTNTVSIGNLGASDVVLVANSGSGANSDLVRVGNGTLSSVRGRVEVSNASGTSRVELNDSAETRAAKYAVSSNGVSVNGRQLLGYTAATPVGQFGGGNGGVSGIALTSGKATAGDGSFNLFGVANSTTIDGLGAGVTFNQVNNFNRNEVTVRRMAGNLTLTGNQSTDRVVVGSSGSLAQVTGTVSTSNSSGSTRALSFSVLRLIRISPMVEGTRGVSPDEGVSRRVPSPRDRVDRGGIHQRGDRRGPRHQYRLGPVDQGAAPSRPTARTEVPREYASLAGGPRGRADPGPGPGQARHDSRRPPARPVPDDVHLEPVERPPDAEAQPQKKTLQATERGRPDIVTARAEWLVLSVGIDPRRLVFLDETFGTTAMTRLYGWGPTNARVNYAAPHGHWKTTTFVAAFRLGGLFAPMVVDGALNGDLFRQYVRQELAPNLRSGDILVMDNLQTHKVKGVAEAVEQRGARVLYLPPYSPDFNPIEQVFSKVKNELRRRELRTITALENAFGESLDWITPQDALHYFQNSGYPTGRK